MYIYNICTHIQKHIKAHKKDYFWVGGTATLCSFWFI